MATITQRGKRWRAQVRRDGRSLSATFATKGEARQWAQRQEVFVDEVGAGKATGKTLGEAFDRYMSDVSPTKKGERWEVIRLTSLADDDLAAVPFNRLTALHLSAWRDSRLLRVSAATVNRELNLISAVINHAIREWQWAQRNPISEIKRPRNPRPRDRRVSDAEIDAICAALNFAGVVVTKRHELAVAFKLAVETGMRKGELLGLRWEDVGTAAVTLTDTKNGDKRQVPLSSVARALFALLPKHGERCFTVSLESADAIFRRAVREAGISGLHFHDSRHEAVTRLAGKLSILELARMIGHRDLKSLQIYYNATAEELAAKLG